MGGNLYNEFIMNRFLLPQTKKLLVIGWLFWLLFLVGCQNDDSLQGDVMLWHGWGEGDTAVLEQIIANYETINPGVTILTQQFPPDQLVERYTTSVVNGLGPDMVILPSQHIMSLADQRLIDELDPNDSERIVADRYFRAAFDSVKYQERLYGLPLSLEPLVMFYNPQLVEETATTLDMLLEQAQAGQVVALNASFERMLWGVQGFGGQILDENGLVAASSGGVANWLRWIQRAQGIPTVIFSRDNEALTDLFVEGTAAYFIAPATQYQALVAQMGTENIAITSLPAGPAGSAGPLLHVESLLFNPHSSRNQRELALHFSRFLTNTEQSRLLMRQTGRAPANRNVQVLAAAYPEVTAVVSQARTAVSTQYKDVLAELIPLGDRILAEMLEGNLEPNEALAQLAEGMGASNIITAVSTAETKLCTQSGRLSLTHGWRGEAEVWLQERAASYMQSCPGTLIVLNRVSANTLLAYYQAQLRAGTASDLLLGSDAWLMTLANEGQITPLPSPQNIPELWQRFSPVAQQTVRYNDTPFAVPLLLELHTLFYNDEWLIDPPQQIDDLATSATLANPVSLPLDFQGLYWGLDAFGGSPLQEDGSFVLEESGLLPWLTWLATYREDSRFYFYLPETTGEASTLFREEQGMMDVTFASEVAPLNMVLGESLAVHALPAGPVAPSRPWATSQALYFQTGIAPEQLNLGLDFARYLTTVEAQAELFWATGALPTNISVTSEENPLLVELLEEVDTAVVPPRLPEFNSFVELGADMYIEVVQDGRAPAEVACELAQRINSRHGHDVPTPTACR